MTGKKIKVIGFIFHRTSFYYALARTMELKFNRQKSWIVDRPKPLPPDSGTVNASSSPAPSPPEYRRRRGDNDLYDMTHGFREPLT